MIIMAVYGLFKERQTGLKVIINQKVVGSIPSAAPVNIGLPAAKSFCALAGASGALSPYFPSRTPVKGCT